MYIGVCGFSWSGSGAVIDLLLEFEGLQIYNEEFLLAYHPDGLIDLDFQLNNNCSKFLSSTVAIPRFKKVSDFLLKSRTKGKSSQLTDDYLSKLVQAKWNGDGQGQILLHNQWIYGAIGGRLKRYYIYKQKREKIAKLHIYPMNEMNLSVLPEQFIDHTQKYVDDVFQCMGFDVNGNIIVNQPFPGNNPMPAMKYFRNSKAVVVDRDPRDVFTFMRVINPGGSYSVPVMDVKTFVNYYRSLRKPLLNERSDTSVLFLRFEDLIYNYEESVVKIKEFLGLGVHKCKKKYFVPEMSMANTMLYKKYPEYNKEIEYITRMLPEYLFDFEKYQYDPSSDKIFDDNPLTISIL